MKLDLSEKQIETLILNYLSMQKGVLCYKNNNVGIYDEKKGAFRTVINKYCPKGVSDIYGSIHSRALFIEVKTPKEYKYLMDHYDELKGYVGADKKKRHFRNQIHFIESNKKMGCMAFFACSLEQVKEQLSVKVTDE